MPSEQRSDPVGIRTLKDLLLENLQTFPDIFDVKEHPG
jgi:hypothetical protein